MEGYQANQCGKPPARVWWNSRWTPWLAGITLGVALILADNYGYGGRFEWAIAFTGGTGLAVAAFWERRNTPWFRPAVGFLIVAHVLALSLHTWRLLPHSTGTYVALKGAIGLDFGVSGLFLLVMHRLFDPRTGFRAHWPTASKVIISIFAFIMLGIFAFVGAVLVNAHNRKIELSRLVFSRTTPRNAHQLMQCIDSYKTDNDEWDDAGGGYPGKQIFDDFFGRTIRVIDKGSVRIVQAETVRGRPLREEAIKALRNCLDNS